jgi:hypothetical protein
MPYVYVDVRPGRRFEVVLENALALIRAGVPKGQAMAEALNVAGYRPPAKDDCPDR